VDYFSYLFAILAFIAVVLFLEGTYLAWNSYKGPEAKRISRRLRAMSAGAHEDGELSIVKKRLLAKSSSLERVLLEIPRVHQLDRLLQQSGLALNVAAFLGLTLLGVVIGLVLATIFGLPLLAVIGAGVVGGAVPLLYVVNAKRKRLITFEQQLPDALDLMGRAMRAGHAFSGALKMVGDEMPEPVAGEFRITFDEINFGISLQDALQNMATRVPSADLRFFVIAVLIQRETGGNLSELLDNISALIRARLKLMGTIRVLSAEGRFSAWILGILPFAVGAFIYFVSPQFMSMLWTDPTGLKMVWIMLVAMVVGIFWMRQIVRIHV
jgi:tight adherence protein B